MPAIRRRSLPPYAKPLTRRTPAVPGVHRRPRTAYETQREAILALLAEGPRRTAELTEALGRKSLPREVIDALVSEGLIESVGGAQQARYRLTEHGRTGRP